MPKKLEFYNHLHNLLLVFAILLIIQNARKIHLEHLGVEKLPPCKYCMYPRKTKKDTGKVGDKTINIDNYTNRSQTVGR